MEKLPQPSHVLILKMYRMLIALRIVQNHNPQGIAAWHHCLLSSVSRAKGAKFPSDPSCERHWDSPSGPLFPFSCKSQCHLLS